MRYQALLMTCVLNLLSILPIQASQTALITEQVPINIEVLSWSPRIVMYRQFLSEAECDHLVEQATPFLTPSTVVDEGASFGNKTDARRSSEGMAFAKEHGDAVIYAIEQRISLLTLIPPENGEDIQILHYRQGGEYQPHYDYFNGSTVGGASYLQQGGQRVASFLMYLNTPEAGGETIFPIADVKVVPRKGDALLFFDCQVDGDIDSLTLHGGAPVLKGEKWLATKWLRQYPFE